MIAAIFSISIFVAVILLFASPQYHWHRGYPYGNPEYGDLPDYPGIEEYYDIPIPPVWSKPYLPDRPYYPPRAHSYPQQWSDPHLHMPGHPPIYSPDYRYVWHPYRREWVDQYQGPYSQHGY